MGASNLASQYPQKQAIIIKAHNGRRIRPKITDILGKLFGVSPTHFKQRRKVAHLVLWLLSSSLAVSEVSSSTAIVTPLLLGGGDASG
jgi:hypothetical protein